MKYVSLTLSFLLLIPCSSSSRWGRWEPGATPDGGAGRVVPGAEVATAVESIEEKVTGRARRRRRLRDPGSALRRRWRVEAVVEPSEEEEATERGERGDRIQARWRGDGRIQGRGADGAERGGGGGRAR